MGLQRVSKPRARSESWTTLVGSARSRRPENVALSPPLVDRDGDASGRKNAPEGKSGRANRALAPGVPGPEEGWPAFTQAAVSRDGDSR